MVLMVVGGPARVKHCQWKQAPMVVEISSVNEIRTHDRTARHAADNIPRPILWAK